MRRRIWLLVSLVLVAPSALPAQNDSVPRRHDGASQAPGQRAPFRRAVVHYGKWVAAAAAVTFTALGAHEHDNSNREWGQLLALCRANNAACLLGPDGRYLSATPEALYQSSLTFDRRARVRLLAGQVALVAAATLFIVDLRHHLSGPGNIPYAKLEVGVARGGGGSTLVGMRVNF
jgi:hypothetical protein